MTVIGWGIFRVKVQGWEHFSTDIRSLSFSASMVFLVGSSEVAQPKCSQFRGVRGPHFTILDLET